MNIFLKPCWKRFLLPYFFRDFKTYIDIHGAIFLAFIDCFWYDTISRRTQFQEKEYFKTDVDVNGTQFV